MKKFLLRLLIFGACFIAIDRMLILLRNLSPSLEVDKRLESVINGKINADVVIFGSSRGARDVLAEKIQSSSGASCFNLSYPGSDISFHEFLLAELLKNSNKKPCSVILVVDEPTELLQSNSIKFRLDRLYPLVKYLEIRKTLIEKGEKDNLLSYLFILHQLNRSNFDIRKKHFTTQDTLLSLGSMPISFQKKNYQFSFNAYYEYPVNEELEQKKKQFLHFVNMCKNNNINLVVVFPPNYASPNSFFRKRIFDLSKGKGVYYMNYDQQRKEYTDAKYYFDNGHLNMKGANIFTEELILFLKVNKL